MQILCWNWDHAALYLFSEKNVIIQHIPRYAKITDAPQCWPDDYMYIFTHTCIFTKMRCRYVYIIKTPTWDRMVGNTSLMLLASRASDTSLVQNVWQPAITIWPGQLRTHLVRGVCKMAIIQTDLKLDLTSSEPCLTPGCQCQIHVQRSEPKLHPNFPNKPHPSPLGTAWDSPPVASSATPSSPSPAPAASPPHYPWDTETPWGVPSLRLRTTSRWFSGHPRT